MQLFCLRCIHDTGPDLLKLPECDLAVQSRVFAFTCQAQQDFTQ